MIPLERKPLVAFASRVAILLGVSLLPIPWLADAYVTAISTAINPLLSLACVNSEVGVQFEPPSHIDREGSWKANLRLENRRTMQAMTLRFDAWSLSYRPMATFVALAAAWSLKSRRRRLVVWGAGLSGMFLATTCFSALPLLSRFASAGAFGRVPGLFIRTVYLATATPIMVYAMPAFVFWLLMYVTSSETALFPMGARSQEPHFAGDPTVTRSALPRDGCNDSR